MRKIILKTFLSPGDIVMLTAAVRDLHRIYPGRFLTDVRTSCPAIWENNPYVSPLDERDPDVQCLEMHYPLIQKSNQSAYHFIHGYMEYLNERLGLRVYPTEFKGDIHLSEEEKAIPGPVEELTGGASPYWIIAAGGKYDFTIKWWHRRRWQAVVDELGRSYSFVQVGQKGHYHPPLRGVMDLRGKTNLRELIRLIYHSEGVICPVTLHMHLAAAVPLPSGVQRARACVVVAGGREPSQWEAYPAHQFLHTIGALDCCAGGGCWKSRTLPLGDGSPLDAPDQLCLAVTSAGLPQCMDMILPGDVTAAVRRCRPLTLKPTNN